MKIFNCIVLCGVLLTPVLSIAEEHHYDKDDKNHIERYYDNVHHDYHNFDARSYNEYVHEKHLKHKDFNRLSKREQSRYWTWYHRNAIR